MFKSFSEDRASPTSTTARFSPKQSPTPFSFNEADCHTLIRDSIFRVKTPYALVQNHPYHDYTNKLKTIDSHHKLLAVKLTIKNELCEKDDKNDQNLITIKLMIHKYTLYHFLLSQSSQHARFKYLLENYPGLLVEYIKKNKNEFFEIILLITQNEKSINALLNILNLKDVEKLIQDIEAYQAAKQQLEQKRQEILDSKNRLEITIEKLKIKIDALEAEATSFEIGLLEDPIFFKTPRFNSLKQLFRPSTKVARFFSDEPSEEDTWGQHISIDDFKASKTVIDAHGMRFYGDDRFQTIRRVTLYEFFTGIENSLWNVKDQEPIPSGCHPLNAITNDILSVLKNEGSQLIKGGSCW